MSPSATKSALFSFNPSDNATAGPPAIFLFAYVKIPPPGNPAEAFLDRFGSYEFQALRIASGEVTSAKENAFSEAKAAATKAEMLNLVMAYLQSIIFKSGDGSVHRRES